MKLLRRPLLLTPVLVLSNLLSSPSGGFAANPGPDKTRPVVAIRFPALRGSVTNAATTVTGKAKDNVGVASVYCQLNTNGWVPVTSLDNYTNWTVDVTPTPGANTLRAYAVDGSGNVSLTNVVAFTYVVFVPMTVQFDGRGTASPNYNGKLLQIGKSYSMTALAARGSAFRGWTGSQTGATARLTFLMASNLAFTAHFADVARPVIAILSPKANAALSTTNVTVSGKAGDNVGVASVFCQVNGTGWNPATSTNNYTNWTADVTLTFGVNTIEAYAEDGAGNRSLTNKVKCSYGLPGPGNWAPHSISGMSAQIRSHSVFTITFGAATFTDTMLPGANVDQNSVGTYTYTKLDGNTAQLELLKTAPPGNARDTNIVTLTFTAANRATATNTDGTAGQNSLTLSTAANTTPASLAGKTLTVTSGGHSTTVVLGNGTFTATHSGTDTFGTFTYTPYSPVGGLLVANFTDPADAGAAHYVVVTFTSATRGSYYSEAYDASATETSTDSGTFTLR